MIFHAESNQSLPRVFVLAEARLYGEALAEFLSRRRFQVVGVGAPPDFRLEALRSAKVDLILVDARLSALIAEVKGFGGAPVVALDVAESEDAVLACAEAGATGFVYRDASLEGLLTTLESVESGEMPCSPRIAARLMNRLAWLAGDQPPTTAADLTPRELEILKLVDAGLSNKEIGRRLSIELSTVKNHVHSILEKLGAHRRGEAAARFRHLSA